MYFLDNSHKERFNKLIEYGDINIEDIERISFFYIIAGNENLYSKIINIYDFEGNKLKVKIDEEGNLHCNVDLSSGIKSLIYLAIQLYNGIGNRNVMQTFGCLDSTNSKLALEAIKLRFNVY